MHIALYKPDIPQNTAAIIRLSACLNLKIHIIEPCGFDLHDARFKRVVMDYLGFSKIFRYEDYDKFLSNNKKKRIVLMTTKAKKNIIDLFLERMIFCCLGEKVLECQKVFIKQLKIK